MLTVRKATAFITRETPNGREVLVFRHPEAGIQLPAGTVEEGETFEQGALREAYEETGLQNLVATAYLGTMETYFDRTHRRVIKDTELFDVPNGCSMGKTLERGNRVLFHKEQDGHAYVTHDHEHDPYFP